MNDGARKALCEVISVRGAGLLDEPKRVDGLLRDFCPFLRVETNVLMATLRHGVPQELLRPAVEQPTVVTVRRTASRMQERFGMAGDTALWAVSAWACALGLAAENEVDSWMGRGAVAEVSTAAAVAAEVTAEIVLAGPKANSAATEAPPAEPPASRWAFLKKKVAVV